MKKILCCRCDKKIKNSECYCDKCISDIIDFHYKELINEINKLRKIWKIDKIK